MTINIATNSLKASLNRANPNSLADQFRQMGLGDVMRQNLHVTLRAVAPLAVGAAAAYPYTIQTNAGTFPLPDDAKAAAISYAYGRAGSGTLAALTVDAGTVGEGEATAPSAGHIGISPSGDLVFASADAWTSVDVCYVPIEQDVVELFLPVVAATGVCTLPTLAGGQVFTRLLESEALTGTTAGKKVVGLPVSSAPATTISSMNTDKLHVWFATADAVLTCRLKLGVSSATDLNGLLEGTVASQLFFV